MYFSIHIIFLIDNNDEIVRGSATPMMKQQNNKTWYKLREEVVRHSIDKFKDVSGFECSVGMIEQSIRTFKTDVFDLKSLAKSYKNLAEIFNYQYDFQNQVKNEEGEKKKRLERARENILKPQYFCIKFDTVLDSSWMRFLSGKSFVYRGDTTMRQTI